MEFRHLITYYFWSRGFSHQEVAKFLGISEEMVLQWESGHIFPNPDEAKHIQETLKIPKIKFWTIYFNTQMRILGNSKSGSLLPYKDQVKCIEQSKKFRESIPHKSIPGDECGLGFGQYELNPMMFSTLMSVKANRFPDNDKKNDEKKVELSKQYEMDLKSLNEIIEGRLPTAKELDLIIQRTSPGVDREMLLSGYISQVINDFTLDLFYDDPVSEETIHVLNRMGRDQVFRKKMF